MTQFFTQRPARHTYYVTVTSLDCWRPPGTIEVAARNAKEAISLARREMRERGHTKHDGRVAYKATKAL